MPKPQGTMGVEAHSDLELAEWDHGNNPAVRGRIFEATMSSDAF